MSFTANTTLPKQYDTYDFISPSRFKGTLKGKVVLITGASAGLGKAAALAFAAAGASVACVARRQAQLDEVVSEIQDKHKVPAAAIAADVSDPSTSRTIVDRVERQLGFVDILLNCAGITRFGTLVAEDDFATWWKVLEVNVRGPAALTHAVLPSMIARKTGTVISISSPAGSQTIPLMTSYAASKAAIIKFQQDLAKEVERHGILSYTINPGTVATDLGAVESAVNMESMAKEPQAQNLMEEFKNTKYQTPQLMADSCVAVCADERFKALNGRLIDVEQPLDEVLKEVEKADGGRIGKEDLYVLKTRADLSESSLFSLQVDSVDCMMWLKVCFQYCIRLEFQKQQ